MKTELTPLESMEAQLRDLQATVDELEAVFQNSYDPIYIVDENGITTKTNDAIERLTGIPKEYYIGKDIRYLEKRGFMEKSVSLEVMKKKATVTHIHENALGKMLLITGSPVFNQQGEVVRVVTNMRDITELNRLRCELSKLRQHVSEKDPFVIASQAMERVTEVADRVAGTETTVLLLGESGVGKEVIARMIHRHSERYENGVFIKVDCGAIPQELLESELFGYESGAFTGAKKEGKLGLFEVANNGTIFLDEIGELPLHLQVKLLRVLQDQEIQRVGGVKTIKINARVVAATNRDLKKMVDEGTFRKDLYYRLCVVPIEIPPLRQRKEEIPHLIQFYLDRFNRKYQSAKRLHPCALELLEYYDWPGNVRELANVIERVVVLAPAEEIQPDHLPDLANGAVSLTAGTARKAGTSTEALGLQEAVERLECEMLRAAYEEHESSYEVAKALKISQSTAIRKAHKYGIRIKIV
jgi:PAS domain S-box-containing protein